VENAQVVGQDEHLNEGEKVPFARHISKLLVGAAILAMAVSISLGPPVGAQSRAWVIRPVPGNGEAIADLSCYSATRCVGVSGYSREVIVTANGGVTWRVFQPATVSGFGFTAVACLAPGVCYATALLGTVAPAGAAIYRSPDGGQRWYRVLERLTPRNHEFRFNDVTCMDPSHCLVSGTDGSEGFIYRTTTGGRTWVRARLPAQAAGGSILGLACAGPTSCLAVQNTDARVYRSTDGGRNWFALPVPANFVPYEKNAATPTGLDAISCGSTTFCVVGGYIAHLNLTGTTQPFKWVTRDGGASWSFLNPFASTGARTSNAVGQNAISCPTAEACVMGVAYGLVYSTSDRGRDWIANGRTPQGDNDVLSVACPTAGHCLIAAVSNFPKRATLAGMLWVERP
jgi:photosystem II stability/assembly factor-like uncharacterized protein